MFLWREKFRIGPAEAAATPSSVIYNDFEIMDIRSSIKEMHERNRAAENKPPDMQ